MDHRTPAQQAIAEAVHRMAPTARAFNLAVGQAVIAAGIELRREFARMLAQGGERRG